MQIKKYTKIGQVYCTHWTNLSVSDYTKIGPVHWTDLSVPDYTNISPVC
jgi:hypothetical protein